MSSRRGGSARGRGRGAVRSDKDGDLQMGDAPPTEPAAARFNPYGAGRGRARHSRHGASSLDDRIKKIDMTISGAQGGSTDDLIAFLLRKFQVKVSQVRGSGERISCSVASPDDAKTLEKASGVRFAGHALQITYATSTSSLSSPSSKATAKPDGSTVETLRQFLVRRYTADSKMLDLSRIADDPILSNFGIVANTSTSSKLFLALMKLLSDEKLDVVSVNLEANKLKDVQGVSALAQHFPKLRNLSLANNDIRRYKDLDAWSAKNKFSELHELILTGNGVREDEIQKNREIEYRSEITKRFPSLKLLDGTPVAQGISFDIDSTPETTNGTPKVELPVGVVAAFYENPTVQATAMAFLGKFFSAYDGDRSAMAPFYADNAIFSMSMNASAPRKKSGGAFAAGAWQHYVHQSRNLTRITAIDARITRTSVGPTQIIQAIKSMPATSHDLTNAQLFCVDAWSFPTSEGHMHIQICSHGEFSEKAPQNKQITKRSFDRTFTIGPATDGKGVDGVIIKSDLLVLRAWGGSDAWKASIPTNGTTTAPAATDRPAGIDDKQFETLKALKAQTGLNTQYAGMCLAQMSWDLAAAVQVTNNLKASNGLPAEAFA